MDTIQTVKLESIKECKVNMKLNKPPLPLKYLFHKLNWPVSYIYSYFKESSKFNLISLNGRDDYIPLSKSVLLSRPLKIMTTR